MVVLVLVVALELGEAGRDHVDCQTRTVPRGGIEVSRCNRYDPLLRRIRAIHVQPAIDEWTVAIDVAAWPEDEEYPYFPEGSRDKRLLRCPSPAPYSLLIAGHRYQFKQSRRIYPDQFWAEVAAFRIGRLIGAHVPPAYPAWDSRAGICAALIEWFYGYPDRPTEGFLSGGMFMKSMINQYDLKRGRQHNFGHIETLCGVLASEGKNSSIKLAADWPCAWAQMLTFDALIGNTDRHHENWGFILDRNPMHPRPNTRLAPAFDNGTSLGHEFLAEQFAQFDDEAFLGRYIRRGCHHLRWQLHDERQAAHAELLLKLAEKHPQCRAPMLKLLDFDGAALESALMKLTELVLPTPLSPERARFMLRLVLARRDHLLNALAPP